jgi:hypothetical protein
MSQIHGDPILKKKMRRIPKQKRSKTEILWLVAEFRYDVTRFVSIPQPKKGKLEYGPKCSSYKNIICTVYFLTFLNLENLYVR